MTNATAIPAPPIPFDLSHIFMVADLARSGLDPNDMDVEPRQPEGFQPMPAYRIWYSDPVSGNRDTSMYRDRFDVKDSGQPKYLGPEGVNGVFLPAGVTIASLISSEVVLILEGEKKAACARKYLNAEAIGIGGCWNFSIRKITGELDLHPVIDVVAVEGKIFVILLDGDAWSEEKRDDIGKALGTLTRALEARGCRVVTPNLGGGVGSQKVAFDDWLMTQTDKSEDALWARLEQLPRGNWRLLPESRKWKIPRLGLTCDPVWVKGIKVGEKVRVTADNSQKLVLDAIGPGGLFLDVYHGPKIDLPPTGAAVPYDPPKHNFELFRHVENASGVKWDGGLIDKAAKAIIRSHQRNLFGESLHKLKWDGTHRLAGMLHHAYGAEDNNYHADTGRSFMVSTVARILRAGCQVDTMIVLVGPQGIGKTRSFHILAGDDALVQTIVDLKEKNHEELIRKMQIGIWMLIDEMAAMSKADIEHVKVLLTATIDHGRELYVEGYRAIPRRVVFVGTTNKPQFLKDPDGSRRFLPIHVTKVDIEYLRENREQLWAEAVHLFNNGYKWYEVRGAEDAQENANMGDLFAEAITSDLSCQSNNFARTMDGKVWITVQQAFGMCGIEVARATQYQSTVINALKRAGLEPRRLRPQKQLDPVSLGKPYRSGIQFTVAQNMFGMGEIPAVEVRGWILP